MRRVVVRIDRLVLRGFRPEDRHAIARELTRELTSRLAETDVAERVVAHGSVARVRAGTVSTGSGAPARVGAESARGIVRAISR